MQWHYEGMRYGNSTNPGQVAARMASLMDDSVSLDASISFVSNGPTGILHTTSRCYRMQRRYSPRKFHELTLAQSAKRKVCPTCAHNVFDSLVPDPEVFYDLTGYAFDLDEVLAGTSKLTQLDAATTHDYVVSLRNLVSGFESVLDSKASFYNRVKVAALKESAQLLLLELEARVKDLRPEILRRAATVIVGEPSRYGKGREPNKRAARIFDGGSYRAYSSYHMFTAWADGWDKGFSASERAAALMKMTASIRLESLEQLESVQTRPLPDEPVAAAARRCWALDRDRLAAQLVSRWDRDYLKLVKDKSEYVVVLFDPDSLYSLDGDLLGQMVEAYTTRRHPLHSSKSHLLIVPAPVGVWLEMFVASHEYNDDNVCAQVLPFDSAMHDAVLMDTALALWDPTLGASAPYRSFAACLEAARALA